MRVSTVSQVGGRPGTRLLRLAVLGITLALLVCLALQLRGLVVGDRIVGDDFIEYWAAGRLQLSGGNPYSPEQLLAVQRAAGSVYDRPVMMWNPPWTLLFVLPFAWLDYAAGRTLWLYLSLAILAVSADWLWRYYGGPLRLRWIAWAIVATFLPGVYALKVGQIGPLALLGVVGFLYFSQRKEWGWAGAATALIAVKPHLLYLFWVALLLWAVRAWRRDHPAMKMHHGGTEARRGDIYLFPLCLRVSVVQYPPFLRWLQREGARGRGSRSWAGAGRVYPMGLSLLLGAGVAGLAATALPMLTNPAVIGQYVDTFAHRPPADWATPTFGFMLRLLFGVQHAWLQFVPTLIGVLWFVRYWGHQHERWVWAEQMPLLLLVSVVTTAYGWTFDYVVMLPAIISIAAALVRARPRPTAATAAAVAVYTLMAAAALYVNYAHILDVWLVWMAPTWLLGYVALRRSLRRATLAPT